MSPEANEYVTALTLFEAQLTQVDVEFANLEAKRAALQETVNGLRKLAGASHTPAKQISGQPFKNKTMRESAKEYLTMVKIPQSAREIAEAIYDGGFKTQIKRGGDFTNVVRGVLTRYPDIFARFDRNWGLKEWISSEESNG
jgi:guanyl-specific ribonuclease Sa